MTRLANAFYLCCLLLLLGTGCTVTKTVTIKVDPPDSWIYVRGNRVPGPTLTEQFVFYNPYDIYTIGAVRVGYDTRQEILSRDDGKTEIFLKLKPEKRTVHIFAEPVPAIISVDGNPITDKEVSGINYELPLGVDPKTNEPVYHEITASRENYQTASVKVSRADLGIVYTLKLKPLTKNVAVITDPPGAKVYVDDSPVGNSPMANLPIEFPYDISAKKFPTRNLRVEMPGYEPKEALLTVDKTDPQYTFKFDPKRKQIRIGTDPEGAKVYIDGNELPVGALGKATADLEFPPINAEGEYKTYTATISKKTDEAEWDTKTLNIGWDNGKSDYYVQLNEVRSRPVQLLMANIRQSGNGWEIAPEWVSTQATTDTAEPAGKPEPKAIHTLAKGFQLGSVAISPDGTQLLFTTLSATEGRNDFRSKINVVKSDGSTAAQALTDGASLDIMPSFTPDGDQVVFSSNRGGKRFQVWKMSTKGVGIEQLTRGDSNDLWPMVDSDPRPRLYYQTMIDTRPDPRIYMVQIGTQFPTDLTMGTQPSVSPKNDSILFCSLNEKTRARDIYRLNLSDRSGISTNITNTPNADERDVSWSSDGRKIVFASNRSGENYDIWMIDLAKPNQSIQITANASHDDFPVFDQTGSNIYFRSNRGGQWGIWKIAVPK